MKPGIITSFCLPKNGSQQQMPLVYSLNAVFINESMPQSDRLVKLNQIAIQQMQILLQDNNLNKLEDTKDE